MTGERTERQRGLAWEFGCFSVERRGGMLAPALFLLPDGRQVAPFQVAPWFSEPEALELPGLLPRLRGDWPCVPFGFDTDRQAFEGWPATSAADAVDEGHGFGANHDWIFADDTPGGLSLFVDYPENHPIRRVERRIVPDAGGPAVDVELTVLPRRDCVLPVGIHPTFRLPDKAGAFEIAMPADKEVATYPGDLDATSVFAPALFAPASAVPLRSGGALDIRRVPFGLQTEEVVQVLEGGGAVTLVNRAEDYAVRLSWNEEDFPSFLLWFSNRGRKFEPWRGRHLALGVEPVCSAFDLGTKIAAAKNPLNGRGVPTARQFRAGEAWTARYRFEVLGAEELHG